jgi:hypothetical protein
MQLRQNCLKADPRRAARAVAPHPTRQDPQLAAGDQRKPPRSGPQARRNTERRRSAQQDKSVLACNTGTVAYAGNWSRRRCS